MSGNRAPPTAAPTHQCPLPISSPPLWKGRSRLLCNYHETMATMKVAACFCTKKGNHYAFSMSPAQQEEGSPTRYPCPTSTATWTVQNQTRASKSSVLAPTVTFPEVLSVSSNRWYLDIGHEERTYITYTHIQNQPMLDNWTFFY